ncbi:ABC transporter ATP-binding protein [Paraburkholderia xenovorans]|uniref:ABC transporter ATP-binding protein n=1 Tax=Paraburkholderia xenovorans TaxID=36873 RepID=UPI0038B82C24
MSALLTVENLSIELPAGADRPYALKQVSFELHRGEILCVVGESGSGKSMSASAILGLLPERVRASSGKILWTETGGNGKEPVDLLCMPSRDLRKWRGPKIGLIFQEPMTALNPLRTIGDQIAEIFRTHTRLSRRAIRAKTHDALDKVNIPAPAEAARRYPHQLSGGQRQRAMIAMAMALEPELLIADEPTTALDVTTQAQILELIHDLQRRTGTSVLFITHDFGVVAEIADRVAVMRDGQIVEMGPADAVLNAPTHSYTRGLIAAVPSLTPATRTIDTTGAGAHTTAALSIVGLSKTYRRRHWPGTVPHVTHALRDVSLDLLKGTTLGIVGESGSGKSTLARTIMRLIEQDSGRIDFDGVNIAELSGAADRVHRKKIQMVFQDPFGSLNPRRRVGDIVSQGPIAYGASPAQAIEKARQLFALVGLAPDSIHRYPHEFSGGQRQRIGLARALALDPQVLVADEPVSALDVSVQAQVLALLARLKSELGLSIIFITHDLRVAAQLCDRIAVMKDGEVVEYGMPDEIFNTPRHRYTQALIGSVPGKHWRAAITA